MRNKEIDNLIKTLGSTGLFRASEEKRKSAALALGDIGDARAVPALITALGDRDDSVRTLSANALGKIGDATAVPALIKALREGESGMPDGTYYYYVPGAAAEALGKIGDSSAVSALINALEYVPSAAAEALGKIGDPSAISALINALENRSGDYAISNHNRAAAAIALGDIGDPKAIPALIKAFGTFIHGTYTHAPLTAFRKIKDPTVVPALINALEDHAGDFRYNPRVRAMAAGELGYIKDQRAIPSLIKALGDSLLKVREAAAWALGEMNEMSALKALEYIMKNDSEERVRKAAFSAAAKIRSSRGILEEEPTHKISASGDIMIDSAKFSNTFSDNSTKISDVGMIKGNIGGKKEVPFSKCPYCGAELNLPKTPKFCPYCGDQLRE